MANTHNSKAKKDQKCKKMEEKKVTPLGLAGIRTKHANIQKAIYGIKNDLLNALWCPQCFEYLHYFEM